MCSAVATELPPYFWTTIPKDLSSRPLVTHSLAHSPRTRTGVPPPVPNPRDKDRDARLVTAGRRAGQSVNGRGKAERRKEILDGRLTEVDPSGWSRGHARRDRGDTVRSPLRPG